MSSRTQIVIAKYLRKLILPGFDGMPFYDVMRFFIEGIMKGAVATRASAISFNLFMAIFPAVIFLFTLIPYIPIADFQDSLMEFLQNIIPEQTYQTVEATLFDIIMQPRSGLLSVGFFLALYFATSGINSIIEAFNQTYHTIETRGFFRQQLASVTLVLILSLLLILGITTITVGPVIIDWLVDNRFLKGRYTVEIIVVLKWLITAGMFVLMFSTLYYFAPAKKKEFRFFSAGATLASIIIILSSIGFNYYVNNFSMYNALYGSIGTLLILLIYIYFNSIILLLGFELNASVRHVKYNHRGLKRRARKTSDKRVLSS